MHRIRRTEARLCRRYSLRPVLVPGTVARRPKYQPRFSEVEVAEARAWARSSFAPSASPARSPPPCSGRSGRYGCGSSGREGGTRKCGLTYSQTTSPSGVTSKMRPDMPSGSTASATAEEGATPGGSDRAGSRQVGGCEDAVHGGGRRALPPTRRLPRSTARGRRRASCWRAGFSPGTPGDHVRRSQRCALTPSVRNQPGP
jgi:hypothetical protein